MSGDMNWGITSASAFTTRRESSNGRARRIFSIVILFFVSLAWWKIKRLYRKNWRERNRFSSLLDKSFFLSLPLFVQLVETLYCPYSGSVRRLLKLLRILGLKMYLRQSIENGGPRVNILVYLFLTHPKKLRSSSAVFTYSMLYNRTDSN